MDSTKDTASGEPRKPQSVTTNAEDDPLLALTDLFSGTSLDGRGYVKVPMSRPLSALQSTPQLNDHCCLALFNQFSLQEQLQLRAVCRQWQVIIEQKCSRMQSLKILRDVRDVANYCKNLVNLKLQDDDQLKLKPVGRDDDLIVSLDQLRQCAHLFADITSFVCFGVYWSQNLDHIPVMFPSLTILSLTTSSSPFPMINLLPNLTSLHLHYLSYYTFIPEEDLFIQLRQLECFSLQHYDGRGIKPLLSQLGPKLTHLKLSNVHLPPAKLTSVLVANPSLATSVTHLTFGDMNWHLSDYFPLLDITCSRMINLVYLHFYYIDLESFPFLTKLYHLTELHIDRHRLVSHS